MRNKNATTLSDVAKRAGVSRVAASVVINGARSGTRVSEATRARILEAAASMGYHPNAVAQGLVNGRMNTIGIVHIVPKVDFGDFYYGPILEAVVEVALQRHQFTTFFLGQVWQDAHASLSLYCDGRSDGLILISPPQMDSDIIPALLNTHVPFVLVGDRNDNPLVSNVDVDNQAASHSLVDYLLDQGHRRIAVLDAFAFLASSVRLRLTGYRQALEEKGIPYDENLVLCGWISEDSVGERIHKLMSLPPGKRPTAIFGITDGTALLAITVLKQMGYRVPEDVSVVGFDDIPSAEIAHPPLTTIRQRPYLVGETAAHLLLDLIEGSASPGQDAIVPTELIIRASAGPAAIIQP